MAKREVPKEIDIAPIIIACDQLSFSNDKDIDDLGRFLEERITPRDGLEEVIRNKNNLELKLTKSVSKSKIKLFIKKFLHKAGIRLDFRVLATFQQGRNKADFHLYPRKVYEV
ncbi:MAG: 60S ribosomal protein L22 [Candidatus Hodarchaeota archaeon]